MGVYSFLLDLTLLVKTINMMCFAVTSETAKELKNQELQCTKCNYCGFYYKDNHFKIHNPECSLTSIKDKSQAIELVKYHLSLFPYFSLWYTAGKKDSHLTDNSVAQQAIWEKRHQELEKITKGKFKIKTTFLIKTFVFIFL